jgi:hypothetical protein
MWRVRQKCGVAIQLPGQNTSEMPDNDQHLLADYARNQSEAAFATLAA